MSYFWSGDVNRAGNVLGAKLPLTQHHHKLEVVPSVQLQHALDEIRPPVQFVELADADHALIGREQAAADEVSEFLARALSD